jgi:hypothetical protein
MGGGKRRTTISSKKTSRKRISEKIPVLMAEGKTQKQAVGEAYGMERAGRLRRHGVYVPVKK